MKMYLQNSKTKRVFAGLMAVWMSGVVFLFCCGAPVVQAKAESCPLAKTHHCDKSNDSNSSKAETGISFEEFQNNGLAFDCCGFFPTIFNKERNVEKSSQIAGMPAKPEIELPAVVFVKFKQNTFVSYNPLPLNRSGTYLKNRVFRI